MKKILSFALTAALLVSVFLAFPAHVCAASASFGSAPEEDCEFDPASGTLNISVEGEADMTGLERALSNIDRSAVKVISFSYGVTCARDWYADTFPSLEMIVFSETVSQITPSIIESSPDGVQIDVDPDNPYYSSEGNCLIEKESGTLVAGFSDSTIPDGVTSVADFAFAERAGLTSVHIPASVGYIGVGAFCGCPSVTEMTVDEENAVYYSADNCIIERGTGILVAGCGSSVIPDGVTSIGELSFAGSAIESVVIPDGVTSIGVDAFSNCVSLNGVQLPSGLERIEEGAFFGCEALSALSIPDSVVSIEGNAFAWSALSDVRLPAGIKSISSHLFECCGSLESITIPNGVETIESYAFAQCTNLKYITMPDSVTEIEEAAFLLCESLSEIRLPNSLESIGENVFQDCTALENVVLPETVVEIGDGAFAYSGVQLTEYENALYIGSEDDPYYALVKTSDMTEESYTIHPDTKVICDNAFRWCPNLKEVEIPDGVVSIGDGAFDNCKAVTEVSIPDTVERIGDGSFSNCRSIESISIPKSVKSLGAFAFGGCSSLKSIKIPIKVIPLVGNAFEGCDDVEDVSCSGTPEEWEEVAPYLDGSAFGGADVHIEEPDVTVLRGDVNGDGHINTKDLSLMKRLLAGTASESDVNIENADVNGDGSVNSADLRALKRLLGQG